MKNKGIPSLIAALPGAFIAVGVKTFLHPCIHEDGSAGACGGAGQMLFWLGIAVAAVAAALAFMRSTRVRIALWAALTVVGVVIMLTPGVIMPLCMMMTMRCQTVTRPAALVLGLLTAVLSLAFCAREAMGAAKGRRA
ncbi:MAG: DUF4418 family protein [Clostridiales bacterium]|nr:DUF4418 family protein [Clostridiales bacterium]